MSNIFNAYLRGRDAMMREGRNALAMQGVVDQRKRDKQMQDIMAGAYTAPLPAAPAMGPQQPGEILPDYPAQQGGFDRQSAADQLMAGGFIPEAMTISPQAKPAADPAAVAEYKFFREQVAPKGPKAINEYLSLKRQGFSIKDIGGVPTRVSLLPGEESTPLSTIEQEISAGAEKEKGKGLGREAAKQATEATQQIGNIQKNITNLKDVIRLVGKGAETGPLAAKLPSFRAASIELDNVRRRLGLDVIGSVTFGALSEAELNMALDTALPTQLQGPDLVQWANGKIAAQEKLRNYMEKQSLYLSKPGNTMAGWIESQREQRQTPQAPQSAIDYLKNNDSPAVRAQFKTKYGYLP